MKKINILFVIRNLEVGGAQELLFTLVNNLNKDTFNSFIICTFEKGPIEGKFKKINIPVHLIGSDRFYNPLTIIKMIYFIKKHKIQVIHSHQYFPDIISRISGYISKVPFII